MLLLAIAIALALVVGVSLGLLGGGGSILTVPILVGIAGMEPKAAIASSLFVVGVTSASAAIAHARAGRVRWPIAIVFGAGGMVGAYLGGHLAGHLPARLLMLLFAAMMAATAIAMLRRRRAPVRRPRELRLGVAIGYGALVGLVAGTVGAGGGFLVVPALLLFGGLRVETAIGTSLVVIAMQSIAGLAGHLGHVAIDWPVTLAVAAMAMVGSVAGGSAAGRIAPDVLRRGFGLLVAAMAMLTVATQLT